MLVIALQFYDIYGIITVRWKTCNSRNKKVGRNMFGKFRRWLSVQLSKYPGRVVLISILLLNIVFLVLSAAVINALALTGTEKMGFWKAAYYTITMVLDAGCITNVVEDIGTAGVALVIVCIAVIIIGMVLFTGAVIGYLTNYISHFIEDANLGAHKLHLSGHTVILNWNSRASEIVNDFLYCDGKQYIVILVPSGKEEIEKELNERIADTLAQERAAVKAHAATLKGTAKLRYLRKNKFRNNLVVLVREGDTFSTKQLHDISLERAKSIIILGSDINNTLCKYDYQTRLAEQDRGNPQSIKALVQVSDITAASNSDDNQKIVVEIEDDWTLELVHKIIEQKQVSGKCNIIPVCVNKILGRLLSQFSLMPELNLAYKELFSNKGATFYSKPYTGDIDEEKFTRAYLNTRLHAIPLSILQTNGQYNAYYAAASKKDDARISEIPKSGYSVKVNHAYTIEQKNIIILGHNSKIKEIMAGFNSFRDEWNGKDGKEIMNVIVIDDKKHLEKMGYYKEYPYVTKVVEADIYDREIICDTIETFVDGNETDTSVLILSDDTVLNEQIDANAIANLIYVSNIIHKKIAENPDFDTGSIDVVVEILNPKHYDIVKSYSIKNVVISNRYISKMVTQLGEKDTLFDFYNDILTYDSADTDTYESKEIYVKKVSRFFDELPAPCTAAELIRAVYNDSADPSLPPEQRNHTIVLGYVRPNGKMELFAGNQNKIRVQLSKKDKLIMYSNH